MENLFLKAMGVKDTVTENGAISNSSSGKAIVDQFATAATYRDRIFADVSRDQEILWVEDPLTAIRFPYYLRMITRKTKVNDELITATLQKGQGVRDESFKRLLSIAKNHSDSFYYNIWMLPIVGSWKDLWVLMYYDEVLGVNTLDRKIIYTLIEKGMGMETHIDLIKKFMPRIKSSSKTKTEWTRLTNKYAKEFADFLGWNYYEYNKFKSTGKAHEFQKAMCSREFDKINWNVIPGRALSQIVHSKFIEKNHLIDSYSKWLVEKEDVNFNGYPYELAEKVLKRNVNSAELMTIDKQFDTLIKRTKDDATINENVWCALDTSGSMCCTVNSSGVTALNVCLSLGIFFSSLNNGAFKDNVIMFSDMSKVKKLDGTFSKKLKSILSDNTAWGGTNFQSVVDEIVRVRRRNPNIPLSEYPSSLLVVSDMQFNDVGRNTNYEAMKSKLYEVFPKEFVDSMKFIWWNVASRTKDFPARVEDGGCYLLSGFDGSIINLLLGNEMKSKDIAPISMEELVQKALTQEILLSIKLV